MRAITSKNKQEQRTLGSGRERKKGEGRFNYSGEGLVPVGVTNRD